MSEKKQTTKTLIPLTTKETKVFEFIQRHQKIRGVIPSYNEIREYLGLASNNSVQNYLRQLKRKGYIQIPGSNQKRALQLLCKTPPNESQMPSPLPTNDGSLFSLPLLGAVAAGKPLEAFAYDEYIDAPSALIRNPQKTFALKVQGQSMIDDGIFNGDIILVQQQSYANTGEIVVAIVDNEATVKRYHTSQKEGKKWIELRPSNSTMTSFWYLPHQVEIRGVLVGLLRKYS
ncbi:MAG TPA: transcriptional repressor LexA [Pseudobdellovibrionaceae bacterium]|nr:transcriptional repressor LexA [Pseudobdellovibrionaceae bacterium]